MKIKRGDLVKVIAGKELSKTGTVEKVIKNGRLIVKDLNTAKKHQKPSNKYPQGGILTKQQPIHMSNVQVICNHCQKPTRIAYKQTKEGKVRICKHCQEILK